MTILFVYLVACLFVTLFVCLFVCLVFVVFVFSIRNCLVFIALYVPG